MLKTLIQQTLNIREVLVFGIIGVLATLTHYGIAVGVNTLIISNVYCANAVGYSTAVLVSYFGHSHFSFQVERSRTRFLKFCVASISTFIASQLVLWILQNLLALGDNISLFIIVLTIPALSYLVNKLWVFKP